MNNRLLIFVFVVAAVLGAFTIYRITQHPADDNANVEDVSSAQTVTDNNGRTLEQARQQVKERIAKFEKMTQDQWNAELKTHPRRHGTLVEATEHAKQRLATLDAMTEEQWNAQQNGTKRQTKPINNGRLPNLGPKHNKAEQDDDQADKDGE